MVGYSVGELRGRGRRHSTVSGAGTKLRAETLSVGFVGCNIKKTGTTLHDDSNGRIALSLDIFGKLFLVWIPKLRLVFRCVCRQQRVTYGRCTMYANGIQYKRSATVVVGRCFAVRTGYRMGVLFIKGVFSFINLLLHLCTCVRNFATKDELPCRRVVAGPLFSNNFQCSAYGKSKSV